MGRLPTWCQGEEEAAARYTEYFAWYTTTPRKGQWEAARFISHQVPAPPSSGSAKDALQSHHAPGALQRTSTQPRTRRCFANEDALAGAGQCANRCFVIAASQALSSCRPFVQYLAEHINRHAALPLQPGPVGDVSSCYVCAIGFARNAAVGTEQGAVTPSEHGLWGGPSWSNANAVAEVSPLMSLFPPNSQHSCSEYIEQAISIIGRLEARIATCLYASTQSCALEDGPRGDPYPPCNSCGWLPAAIRPPISFATIPSRLR